MYQKCVCFIFLVILAILSCSGFRIDSLAMTDLTKKNNFNTSPNTHANTEKYLRADTLHRPHRIRHHRLWRTQAHNRYPKPPHIDAIVYPPPQQSSSKSIASPDFSSSSSNERLPTNKLLWQASSNDSRQHRPKSESARHSWPLTDSSFIRTMSNLPFSEIKPTSSEVTQPVNEFSSTSSEVSWPVRGTSSEVLLPFPRTSSEVDLPVDHSESKPASMEVMMPVNLRLSENLTPPTIFPNENLAQIPPTDFAPVNFVVSRSQRSPEHRPERRRNRWTVQQKEDIFTKAYKARYVVIAEVESKPKYINESTGSCQCYVKVHRDFKNNAGESFGLVNKFLRHMLTARCDLVKKMKNSKRYMLLLNENLQLLDAPRPKAKLRGPMMRKLERVCKRGFVPTKPHIKELKEVTPKKRRKIERRNRILICNVTGFPLPKITWRRRNEVLHPSRSYNVLYKSDEDWRQSKLVIKKPDAEYLGQYECVAESLNGHTVTQNFTLLPPQPNKTCMSDYKEVFCQNGGTCFYESTMNFYGCICPESYSGEKCEVKNPGNTSMYPQPALYACNLGLQTKYNC